VTEDNLLMAVWPDTFGVEGNLSRTVFTLPKALGESPQDHKISECFSCDFSVGRSRISEFVHTGLRWQNPWRRNTIALFVSKIANGDIDTRIAYAMLEMAPYKRCPTSRGIPLNGG
jgi:hypothetical protein